MPTLLFIAILCLVGFVAFNFSPAGQRAKSQMRKTAAAQARIAEEQPPGGVLVVEFTDMTDLLIKLRKVRTGQETDLRQVGPGMVIATGIRCGDTAAVAAFMAKANAENEFLSREIQREINRIDRMR